MYSSIPPVLRGEEPHRSVVNNRLDVSRHGIQLNCTVTEPNDFCRSELIVQNRDQRMRHENKSVMVARPEEDIKVDEVSVQYRLGENGLKFSLRWAT